MVNKEFCMSSFLMYRALVNDTRFTEDLQPYHFTPNTERFSVRSSDDVDSAISDVINEALNNGKCALMLSGGIDSAILAKYMPQGTVAYTLRCLAPGALDETGQAKQYADECGLIHKTVDVSWDDYINYSPALMKHKGAPIHSIEPQIYKAALTAKEEGIDNLIFGENADMIFGGMDGLLSKDWLFDEFVERYTYLDAAKILRNSVRITEPFEKYRQKDKIDFYHFICDYFYMEANGSYDNACSAAGVSYISPFNRMILDVPLDYDRIRGGEPKYMLRELFKKKYNTISVPPKTPMPRAVKQWLENWPGPAREEFREGCIEGLSGDQKWMVYILELFLNMIGK
jgi:asparagine synthetase B (glutamine-hydrolysing)